MLNNIDYLRVSVTNRCNLRCIYCHPLGDKYMMDYRDILELDEIVRIVRLFVKCGVKKVRLTGGEPLLRDDILQLVKEISSTERVEDLSVTTNGVYLKSLANRLKAVGLQRINISVDSTDRTNYKNITGFDLLCEVIDGIQKAIEAGLNPVKINCVIVKGINSGKKEILSLARMSIDLPIAVRFVEYYPTSHNSILTKDYVPNIEIRNIIEDEFGHADKSTVIKGYGPAEYFKIKDSAGEIGFISGRSTMFCVKCNRLRLSCDGKIKPCLYAAKQYDLKEMIRNGRDDEEIMRVINEIIHEKKRFNKQSMPLKEFSMQSIGG
jgi:cyclic pyranopterin phosphate synthase